MRSDLSVVADTDGSLSLDDLASKPADTHTVPSRTNFLKTKALVRFAFYYKSRSGCLLPCQYIDASPLPTLMWSAYSFAARLRACGLLDNAAGGSLPIVSAIPRPAVVLAAHQRRASDAAAAASGGRAQSLPQHALTAWQTPQLVLRTDQSQNLNQHSNQNQNQNQNESRNSSQNQMARSQLQEQNRSADPRRRAGFYNRGPAQSAPGHGLQAAGPSTSAHASGAKPPLLASSPSTVRAEDRAPDAKRIKREAFDDGLQQASGSAPRSPLAPTARPAARVSTLHQPSDQAARPSAMPQPSTSSAGPSHSKSAVPSGPSRSLTGSRGPAVIDLTSDSDDEQERGAPARKHTDARQDGAQRGIKQEGGRQAAMAPAAHQAQGATMGHPADAQRGNRAAAATQHRIQEAQAEHSGKSRFRAMALSRIVLTACADEVSLHQQR